MNKLGNMGGPGGSPEQRALSSSNAFPRRPTDLPSVSPFAQPSHEVQGSGSVPLVSGTPPDNQALRRRSATVNFPTPQAATGPTEPFKERPEPHLPKGDETLQSSAAPETPRVVFDDSTTPQDQEREVTSQENAPPANALIRFPDGTERDITNLPAENLETVLDRTVEQVGGVLKAKKQLDKMIEAAAAHRTMIKLRRTRESLNMTQAEAAQQLDISLDALRRWESFFPNARAHPSVSQVKRYASEVLGVDPTEYVDNYRQERRAYRQAAKEQRAALRARQTDDQPQPVPIDIDSISICLPGSKDYASIQALSPDAAQRLFAYVVKTFGFKEASVRLSELRSYTKTRTFGPAFKRDVGDRLTQSQLAELNDWSLAKVQRIESGDEHLGVTPSITDARAMLDRAFERGLITQQRYDELLELAREDRLRHRQSRQ